MNIIADLHCHTIVSKHALSTVSEMAKRAKEMNFFALAITDHGPELPDGGHSWYFWMLQSQPDILEDIFVFKGIEANVTDKDGSLDYPKNLNPGLDIVIASVHSNFFERLTVDEATQMWLNIARNDCVDIIGHSEEERYRFDYDIVTREFAHCGKVVEVNANSASVRPGNEENLKRLLQCCKKNGTNICVNSDAHSVYMLGNFSSVLPLLREIDFPEELVVNSSVKRLCEMIKTHNTGLYQRILKYESSFI